MAGDCPRDRRPGILLRGPGPASGAPGERTSPAGGSGGRPGHALLAELLGVDRQLLRGAAAGGRNQSDQYDADPRRDRIRGPGLRRSSDPGFRGEGPEHPGSEGAVGRRRDHPVREHRTRRSALPGRAARGAVAGSRPRGGAGRGALDDRLHLGHHGAPEGCHVEPSRRDAQRRDDRADAPEKLSRHHGFGPASSPRVRKRGHERRGAVRHDSRLSRGLQGGRDSRQHREVPRHDAGRRPDDVHVSAR